MSKKLEDKGAGEITFKDLGLVVCPIKKKFCEVRGNYFRCYDVTTTNYETCKTYMEFMGDKKWKNKK